MTKQSLKIQRKRLNLVWLCLKVWCKFLTRSLSIKTNEKGFVYKCKLILHNLTCSLENQSWMTFFTEWFQIQTEFATLFKEMSPQELNKCLQKFYLSARKWHGSFFNKKTLTAIWAAFNRHLQSPPFSKPFFYSWRQFNDVNTSLSNFLRTLRKSSQIPRTMHKQPLTKEVVAKLYEESELVDTDSLQSKQPGFLSVCSLENKVVKTSSF